MAAPAQWTTTLEVVTELGGGTFTPNDTAWIGRCATVADQLVRQWRPEIPVRSSDPVMLGATRLAASLYRRRGATGAEFAEFSDMATPILPGVIDAEIQALIGIGRHHDPVIA